MKYDLTAQAARPRIWRLGEGGAAAGMEEVGGRFIGVSWPGEAQRSSAVELPHAVAGGLAGRH